MISLDDIWNEYITSNKLTSKTEKDLAWHIEHDVDPADAIIMATDLKLKKLAPVIANQLNNEDDYIRELAIGCLLGGLQLPEYAKTAFEIILSDDYENVRGAALFSIGDIINLIKDRNLQFEIGNFIFHVLTSDELELESFKREAYNSVLTAMEVPVLEQPRVRDLADSIDLDLVEKFKNKYCS